MCHLQGEAFKNQYAEELLELNANTLAGVAQWIECWPESNKVAGLIPSQGTCLGCRPGPQKGVCKRQPHTDVSLSSSLPSPLSKNK